LTPSGRVNRLESFRRTAIRLSPPLNVLYRWIEVLYIDYIIPLAVVSKTKKKKNQEKGEHTPERERRVDGAGKANRKSITTR
jgi:hypothetical protein